MRDYPQRPFNKAVKHTDETHKIVAALELCGLLVDPIGEVFDVHWVDGHQWLDDEIVLCYYDSREDGETTGDHMLRYILYSEAKAKGWTFKKYVEFDPEA